MNECVVRCAVSRPFATRSLARMCPAGYTTLRRRMCAPKAGHARSRTCPGIVVSSQSNATQRTAVCLLFFPGERGQCPDPFLSSRRCSARPCTRAQLGAAQRPRLLDGCLHAWPALDLPSRVQLPRACVVGWLGTAILWQTPRTCVSAVKGSMVRSRFISQQERPFSPAHRSRWVRGCFAGASIRVVPIASGCPALFAPGGPGIG